MVPNRAIVLAAGLGTRMRPYNGHIPKPLVEIGGKSLIDYSLDRLADAGVERAVVNVHHLADVLERHLAPRQRPQIVLVNSDTVWLDGVKPNFRRLAEAFDPDAMDALLLLAPTTDSIGYAGRGDFAMLPDGRLRRRRENQVVPFVYAGAAILSPALFADTPTGAFPLTFLFDRAGASSRLFGLRLEGVWMHVGTPEAVAAAEAALAATY
jgi:MurNAc alpha-1-phosphate uridylyltransferase